MSLSKKDGPLIYEIIAQNAMIDEFYDELINKIKTNSSCVMDIMKDIIVSHSIDFHNVMPDYIKVIKTVTNAFLLKTLKYSMSRGIAKINNIYNFTDSDIELILPTYFSEFDSFVVIGCPMSTDIDVIAFVRHCDHADAKVKSLSNKSYQRLQICLTGLGYDISVGIDLNLIYIDPQTQMITASTKGDIETQNIINATWIHHKQIMNDESTLPFALVLHPVRNVEFTPDVLRQRLRTMAKYILDYAEDIVLDYKSFRPIKMTLYSGGGNKMMSFVKDICKYLSANPSVIWHDRFKSIIMKIIQIIMIYKHNRCVYTKIELAESMNDINFIDGALWYLFRGKKGIYDPLLLPYLMIQYGIIVDKVLTQDNIIIQIYDQQVMEQSVTTHSTYPDCMKDMVLLRNFINHPIKYSQEFEQLWLSTYYQAAINEMFPIKSSNPVEFKKTYIGFPDAMRVFDQCIIWIDQRSPDWLHRLKNKYKCGKCSKVIENTFDARYNLIRGSIIEQLCMHLFDPKSIKGFERATKWITGFIVEADQIGAYGFAPDLFLMIDSNPPEFVLVEIKAMKSSNINSDYYRSIDLASSQVKSGKEILSKFLTNDQLTMNKGIIIICCIENNVLEMKVHIIDI